MAEYWGLDIGGTKCAFVRSFGDGKVTERRVVATRDFPRWEELLLALLPKPGELAAPKAIGVSCGGPLDSGRGLILSPPNLPGWDEVPVTRWLSERYGAPSYLQNDADACALAEWRFGAGKGVRNMVFLTFGTGFGAGLILNGRLYSGTCGMAGEIGHVRAAEDGPVGYGKAGSFEGFCSGGGIAQMTGGVSAKDAVLRADAGDETMRAALEKSAEMLGRSVALLVDLLNPERIVIGSIFARAERYLRPGMEKILAREALLPNQSLCRVVPAALGDQIGDIAALTVAIDGAAEGEA